MNSTLRHGLTLLEMLSRESQPHAVKDLAARLRLPPSHVHRLLQTLCAAGYVRRMPGRKYAIAFRVFELAASLAADHPLRQCAMPLLRQLADGFHGSAHLLVEGGDGPISIMSDSTGGRPAPRLVEIGNRLSRHASATGKLFAALNGALPTPGDFVPLGPNTILDMDSFRVEMAKIRRLGYSVSEREVNDSILALSAPILDAQRVCVAALGFACDLQQVEPDRDALIDGLLQGAEKLSHELQKQTEIPIHYV